jgi:O-antigen biosynthesis protein
MKSLIELYREHQGKVSNKWSIYLSEYDRIFSCFRDYPVRILEIGVQNGGSLEIWGNYFPKAQAIVGCDINLECGKLIFDDPRINVVIGDAKTENTTVEILNLSPGFEIIIDDGSHLPRDVVNCFSRYFRYLGQGGIFIVEDLHCSYWSSYKGGLYYPYSSISFFKRLADVVNHEHWGIEKRRKDLLQGFANQFETDFDESNLAEIHSIEFFNSVCVVHKGSQQNNLLGKRFVAGGGEIVAPGHFGLSGTFSSALCQVDNPWSEMLIAPEEDWERQSSNLGERNKQIAALNQSVAERDGQIAILNQSLAEREGQIAALNQSVAERDGQIAGLEYQVLLYTQSTSWRVTRPFRFIGQQLRKLQSAST